MLARAHAISGPGRARQETILSHLKNCCRLSKLAKCNENTTSECQNRLFTPSLGCFSLVLSSLSDQLVLKWNARVLRTGSGENGSAQGSGPLSYPTPVVPSTKAREFGELWQEKCTRAPWTFPFKLARTSSFRPARTDKWKTTII